MSWKHHWDEGVERGGACASCGERVEQKHWTLCSSCFAARNGWRRPARPEPGAEPPSFIAGLSELREQVAALAARVAQLEREELGP